MYQLERNTRQARDSSTGREVICNPQRAIEFSPRITAPQYYSPNKSPLLEINPAPWGLQGDFGEYVESTRVLITIVDAAVVTVNTGDALSIGECRRCPVQ